MSHALFEHIETYPGVHSDILLYFAMSVDTVYSMGHVPGSGRVCPVVLYIPALFFVWYGSHICTMFAL